MWRARNLRIALQSHPIAVHSHRVLQIGDSEEGCTCHMRVIFKANNK